MVEDDAIGVGLRNDCAESRICFQVENYNRAVATIADKSASDFRNDRDTMSVFLARNIRDGLARCRIDHHRVRGPWNVEPTCLWIES